MFEIKNTLCLIRLKNVNVNFLVTECTRLGGLKGSTNCD